MSEILKFEKKTATTDDRVPVFICVDCRSEEFLLHCDGHVYCGECDAEMQNLTIVEDKP